MIFILFAMIVRRDDEADIGCRIDPSQSTASAIRIGVGKATAREVPEMKSGHENVLFSQPGRTAA
jgi:hypothetical protein